MQPTRLTPRYFVTLLGGLLLLVPVGVSIAPKPANALFGDDALAVKEYVLDNVAWMVKRAAVQALVRSSVNWINSGFKGSPAFVTNLRENLLIVGDTVAADFFDELANSVIDSPYQDEIALAIRSGYYLSTGGTFYVRNPFTLNQQSSDPRAFLGGDFSKGGFSAFFSTVTNCQDNPHCAYQLALSELNSRVTRSIGYEKTLLDWGQGFKSFRGDCNKPPAQLPAAAVTAQAQAAADAGGAGDAAATAQAQAAADSASAPVKLAKKESCLDAGIRTPGAIIAPRLNEALGAGERDLITADEINEVVGALFAQLVNQAFGSNGLINVAAPSYGGGRSYLDSATDPSQNPGGVGGGGTQSGQGSQDDIIAYITNWQKLGSAAEAALAYCQAPFVTAAQSGASAATIKGTNALAAADSSTRATSGSIITAAEVQQSRVDAAESGNSLYAQLQKIVTDKKCPST